MRAFKATLLVPLLLITASACTSIRPKVDGLLNPEYSTQRYSRLLIVADGGVIDIQKQLENGTINSLKDKFPDLVALPAHQFIFPPLSFEKVYDTAKKNELQAVLLLTPKKGNLSRGAERTSGSISRSFGSNYTYESTTYSPLYLTVSIEAMLIDAATREQVWVGQSVGTFSGASEINAMYPAFAGALADELVLTRVISTTEVSVPVRRKAALPESQPAAAPADNLSVGFRNLKWGDPPTSSMEVLDNKADAVGYIVDGDRRETFGHNADGIAYYFRDNRFSRLEIIWGWTVPLSEEQFLTMRKTLNKLLGKPRKTDVLGNDHWDLSNGMRAFLSDINHTQMKKKYPTMKRLANEKDGYILQLTVDSKKYLSD